MHVHDSTNRPKPSKCFFVLLLLVSGCARPSEAPAPYVPAVNVAGAARTDSARALRLSGSLAAERSTHASFAVPGTVEEVFVGEGAVVRKGQPLARLSARVYRDALGIAQAKSTQAEDAYRRLEPMFKNQTLAAIKMVEVETAREEARLAVSMARKNLDDTLLRAPESGVIARRNVEVGTVMAPGMPTFTVVQTDTMLASVPVPEMQLARIKVGDAAQVTVPALGQTFEGTIREIAITADLLTRTYSAKVALPNKAGELRIGMVAEVIVKVPGDAMAVVVPPEAVRVDGAGRPSVFVVGENERVERRAVEIAGYVGEAIALSKGVSEGERVVTSGTPMLADQMTVRVVEARR